MSEENARRIREVTFTPVRRRGYDMGEVDAALDALAEAAERGQDLAALVREVRLTPVRLREGYDIDEVDAWLAAVASGEVPEPAPRQQVDLATHSRDIRRMFFRRTSWLQRGYDTGEVRALLAQVAAALDSGQSVTDLVRAHSFPLVRHGYRVEEVDGFFEVLIEEAR